MNVFEISNCWAAVGFDYKEAATLARICEQAGRGMVTDDDLAKQANTYATAFKALSVATLTGVHLSPNDRISEWRHELAGLGFGDLTADLGPPIASRVVKATNEKILAELTVNLGHQATTEDEQARNR
jgi:hypothetical protein